MDIHGAKGLSAARAGLAAAGLFFGLCGIAWQLPSRERVREVLPAEEDTPDFHRALADSWKAMHERLGPNLMINPEAWVNFTGVQDIPAGWTFPPAVLLNSYRSFYVRSAHDDEQTWLLMLSRMKPKKLEFNPHMFTYGGAHVYAMGACLAAAAAVHFVHLQAGLLPYLDDPAQMARLYLVGRLMSIAAAIGCAWVLLRLGRRHLSAGAGALAGAMFLMTPATIVQVHVLKNHPFWSFFALLALDQTIAVAATGAVSAYVRAGLCAGLAVGAFLGSWTTCLLPVLAALLRVGRGEAWAKELRGLIIAGAAAAFAFALTNPYFFISFKEAMAEMKVLSDVSHHVSLLRPAAMLFFPIRRGITTPVFVLALAGAALAAARARRDPALLLCLGALLCGMLGALTMGETHITRFVRYFLAWTAVAELLAAQALVESWRLWPRLRPALAALGAAALLNLGFQGFSYARNFRLDEGERSSHARAGRWIEENVPSGATIGLLRPPAPQNAPYFHFSRYHLRLIDAPLFGALAPDRLPEYVAFTMPDYDDRLIAEPNLSRYERLARFDRQELCSWLAIDPTSTTANPVIEIYRLKKAG